MADSFTFLTYEAMVDIAFEKASETHTSLKLEEVVTHVATRAVDCTFIGDKDSTVYVHVNTDGSASKPVTYSWHWKPEGASIKWPCDLSVKDAINIFAEEYPRLPYSYIVLRAPSAVMRRDSEYRFSTGIGNVIVDVPGRYAIPEINSQAMRRVNRQALCDV